MKFSKKTLLMAASIVLCMTMTAIGTVAYLTDRAAVANTFTVGNIDIIVDETMVDQYGQPTEGDWRLVDTDGDDIADTPMNKEAFNEWKEKEASSETPTGDYDKEFEELEKPEEYRTENNDYKLIPGMTYIKDPTMTVMANSENAYVRMVVMISPIKEIEEAFGKEFELKDYVQWNDEKWRFDRKDTLDNTLFYYFNYFEEVKTSEEDQPLAPLFEEITIPGELTEKQLEQLGTFNIDIEGHAIQTAAFENAEEAWKHFKLQYEKDGN